MSISQIGETSAATADLPAVATAEQVHKFTQISLPTLARKRADGTGPKVLRIGRSVRYRREDVLAWLESLSEAG